MGAGDDIVATGMARGASSRGKRIAFGDGQRIIWGPFSKMVFANNPNVLPPGSEKAADAEWIRYYKGHRVYNRQENNRWVWNMDFRVTPGEIFFSDVERQLTESIDDGFVLVEPNVPRKKGAYPNKQWSFDRFQSLVDDLVKDIRVVQLIHEGSHQRLFGADFIETRTFRQAVGVLSRANLFIGSEGGMHHAAAAVGTHSVVMFGGWIPPSSMGYDGHVNMTGGETEFCGSLEACDHCRRAMDRISVEEVTVAARRIISDDEV